MMLVFPVVELPRIVMPLLVGRSEDKCSRISLNSHFRPTKVLEAATGGFGTSKNNGLRIEESLLLLTLASIADAVKEKRSINKALSQGKPKGSFINYVTPIWMIFDPSL